MFILVVQFVYPWLCLAYRLLSHVFLSVKAMCSCVIAVESSRMSCAYISDVIISLAQLATPSHIQLSAKRGDITIGDEVQRQPNQVLSTPLDGYSKRNGHHWPLPT